jgi:hypothetical protein
MVALPGGLEAVLEGGTASVLLILPITGVRLTGASCRGTHLRAPTSATGRLATPSWAGSRLAVPTFEPEY